MFGKRLRSLRKEKKLTMKEFGEKFNLAESTISGYENETRTPDIKIINKFMDFFDVSYEYLMGRSEIRNQSFDSLSKINKLLEKYNIDQSGFFDIEKWKAMGPDEIRELESYFQYITEKAKKKDQQD